MMSIDLANAVFLISLAVGALLLLVGRFLDDETGRLLQFLHLGTSVRGVPIFAYVLGFLVGFGVGGLVGTRLLNAETLPAIALGVVGGMFGVVIVWTNSDARVRHKAGTVRKVDLDDLVGHRGRVPMELTTDRRGTVSLSYRGAEREFAATSASNIPAGSLVVVDDVDETNSTLVVTLARHTGDLTK